MENQNLENKKTLQNNPEYFGAYLNMARHNVFLIINHLTETFNQLDFLKIDDDADIWKNKPKKGQEKSPNETNIILNIFDSTQKKYEDERKKVFDYLIRRHHFSFLKIFINDNLEKDDLSKGNKDAIIDYDGLNQFLNLAFEELNHFRNAYTHYLAIDDKGIRVQRKINIKKDLKPKIELLFKYAPRYSYLRNTKTQTIDDYNHILKKYQLFESVESNCFTEQGLFFFINLFLERSHATKFLKKFTGFKDESTSPFRATIQAFTAYSIKVPDNRLGNYDTKQSLLLEMLSELNKCPKELFNRLTDKDKELFDPKLEETAKQNLILNNHNYNDINDDDLEDAIYELTALKRQNDRFPYFGLRFLEETNAFKNIRFQITIGKLIVKRYDKKIIGEEQDRRVIKTINAFGKLSDFEHKETEILAILKKGFEKDDSIVFEQFAPHYNMNNNKIGFYIFDENDVKIKYPNVFENKTDKTEFQNNPSGFISIHDLPKVLLLENLKPSEVENQINNFVLTTNVSLFDEDLINEIKQKAVFDPESFTKKVFDRKKLQERNGEVHFVSKLQENNLLKKYRISREQLLALSKDEFKQKTKDPKTIETFSQIKYQYYLEQRRFELQKCLPEGLLVNQLPQRMIDYLMNISEIDNTKRIHLKIRTINEETKKLLKESKKEPNENSKPKLGEYAQYIARDILNMIVSVEIKNKITNPYSNKLQNKIAYFSTNKEDIVALCNELKLFDLEKGHVFLTRDLINNSKGVIDFYQRYLGAKKSWITKLLEKGKTGGYRLDLKKLPYEFQRIKTKLNSFNFNTWLENKSKLPINLPTSLLDQTLNNKLKDKLKHKNIQYNETDKFTVLLRKLNNNDTQPFYNYDRKYNINKTEKIIKQISNLDSKTIKATYDNFVEANEKLIRFSQTKDRIMKLLCDTLLTQDNNFVTQEFMLKDIYPNSKLSILEQPDSFKHKLISDVDAKTHFTIIAEDTAKQKAQIAAWNALPEDIKQSWLVLDTKEKQEQFLVKYTEPERKVFHNQKGYQWKFKDFGRYKRFIKDRRIPELSKYFEDNEIPFDLLEYQINEYDRVREKIFNLVFLLEKTIANKDFDGIKSIEFKGSRRPKGFNEVQFGIFIEWMKGKIKYDENLIKSGRNKFSHSQFPVLNDIPKITKQQMDDFEYYKEKKEYKNTSNISIAQQILEKYETEIEKINQSLV
jgi:hypothetical protein